MYAAALNGNYKQLVALVHKSEWRWAKAIKLVAPAIARSGSVELFEQVFQGNSRQILMYPSFWANVIEFDKRELFLEFVRRLNPGIDKNDQIVLWNIFNACCRYERQDLVQVLMEHQSEYLLKFSIENVLSIVFQDDLELFRSRAAASPFDYYRLLDAAKSYNGLDIRRAVSSDDVDESVLLKIFSSVALSGNIEGMRVVLEVYPGCFCLIPTLFGIKDQIIATIANIGYTGLMADVELVLRCSGPGYFPNCSQKPSKVNGRSNESPTDNVVKKRLGRY